MTINSILNQLKELIPDIKINKQPETSLIELLKLENQYNLNTCDAINLYLEMDEKAYLCEEYDYLINWNMLWLTYMVFNGDMSLLNKQ